MKDYPDRMTAEEARRDDVWGYCRIGGMAEPCKDGGKDAEVFAWGR